MPSPTVPPWLKPKGVRRNRSSKSLTNLAPVKSLAPVLVNVVVYWSVSPGEGFEIAIGIRSKRDLGIELKEVDRCSDPDQRVALSFPANCGKDGSTATWMM